MVGPRKRLPSRTGLDPELRDAVREALARVTPVRRVREHLIDSAMAHVDEIIEADDRAAFRLFVLGPLADAVETVFGPTGVATVERHLQAHLLLEESGVVRVDEACTPTDRAPKVPVVLVVTGHVAARDAYVRLLSENGYAPVVVDDSASAVCECAMAQFDAVVADVDWLDTDAVGLAGMLERAMGEDSPPLLVLSRRAATAPAGGVHAVLRKPLDRNKLLEMLRVLVTPPAEATFSPSFEMELDDDTTTDDGPPLPSSPLVALVYEALGQIATPSVMNALLRSAMEHAGVEEMPQDGKALHDLVAGPLRRDVGLVLGDDAAEAFIAGLTPVLEQARRSLTPAP